MRDKIYVEKVWYVALGKETRYPDVRGRLPTQKKDKLDLLSTNKSIRNIMSFNDDLAIVHLGHAVGDLEAAYGPTYAV